jgi:hypothetical protein
MLLTLLFACKPPPPAPDGLDEVTRYMVREFYADDASFAAGFQGFMNWFHDEGSDLVGQEANSNNTDTFTLNDLNAEDVAQLPLLEMERDLTRAKGVISLAEMACSWEDVEALLIRPDQDTIFSGDWENYERTYLSDRDTFEAAGSSGDFAAIDEALDPFSESFDPDTWGKSLLRTDNIVDPNPVLFADLSGYPMNLDIRHGSFEIDGESVRLMSILTWMPEPVFDESGNNGLVQTFSVELNIELEAALTLRALAVWAEPSSTSLEPDSPLVLNYGVNKSLESSQRMSGICSGEIEIE